MADVTVRLAMLAFGPSTKCRRVSFRVNRSRLTWSLAAGNIERFNGPQKLALPLLKGICNTIGDEPDQVT